MRRSIERTMDTRPLQPPSPRPIAVVRFAIAVFLLFSPSNCDALPLKCPIPQMHLQKIVGFRPPLEHLTERNLIYAPPPLGAKSRIARDGWGLAGGGVGGGVDGVRPDGPLASAICWQICNEDDNCMAYAHLLDTDECYGFSYFRQTQKYRQIREDATLVADSEAIYYEKTCLKVPEACKSRLWTLTRIPGTSLVFQGKKTIATLVTRRECAERCLFEQEFQCLSASFAPSHRNNRARFGQSMTGQPKDTLGRCILSDRDKTIQPDAFRAAPYDEEYIENQCHERPMESDSCSYELYSNSSFVYAEARHLGLTQKECQAQCTHETRFYCQGVTFSAPPGDLSRSQCLLHSEDIISMGPRSLELAPHSVYMRRVKCLDVQVVCSHEEMAVKYTPKDWFRGKMYVSAHSKDCVALGNGTRSTLLRLPIGSEAKENRCGVLRAYQVTKEYQRVFISALIVVQNNINVQTQGDRLIKVGCIMSNSSAPDDSVKGEGEDAVEDREDDVPNAIALESSLELTQQALPNEGSVHFNFSGHEILPQVTLQVVDLMRKRETNDVQIGQSLELQIIAESPSYVEASATAAYDIRATSLVAKTQNNQNYVLLIDERGCPTDVTVFPALERVRTASKSMLRARFHAFKFTGTSMVSFDVKIHLCPHRCPETNCLPHGSASGKSWHRRRRQTEALHDKQIQVKSPVYISTVMDVANTTDLESDLAVLSDIDTEADLELPLNFNLNVRGPDNHSFIYAERGILLIAGADLPLQSDGVYINHSFLIALIIFWLCFQVALMFGCCYVIQKYKHVATMEEERRKIQESLDYRRVHWADQGGYTL